VSVHDVGSVGALVDVTDPEMIPLRLAFVKFVPVRFAPLRLNPRRDAFEKFTFVRFEFDMLTPVSPVTPANDIPVRLSPERFAEGPTKYPWFRAQPVGRTGDPLTLPERMPVMFDVDKLTGPK
jgi:hypothetical protein